jgi:hypothetical protein
LLFVLVEGNGAEAREDVYDVGVHVPNADRRREVVKPVAAPILLERLVHLIRVVEKPGCTQTRRRCDSLLELGLVENKGRRTDEVRRELGGEGFVRLGGELRKGALHRWQGGVGDCGWE